MPNFLHVESTPFDPETYEDQDALDEEEQGADGGAQNAKLKLENTLRWRQALTADGDAVPVKQSNARFVKWSDGSLSLVVGRCIHTRCLSSSHQFHGTHSHRASLSRSARKRSKCATRTSAANTNTSLCVTLTSTTPWKHRPSSKRRSCSARLAPHHSRTRN